MAIPVFESSTLMISAYYNIKEERNETLPLKRKSLIDVCTYLKFAFCVFPTVNLKSMYENTKALKICYYRKSSKYPNDLPIPKVEEFL